MLHAFQRPLAAPADAKAIYFDLLENGAGANSLAFLTDRVQAARELPADLPADPQALPAWVEHSSRAVGRRYQDYLSDRRAGAPRRYFRSRSHALYFLKGVAPTKLVDGAWLYGLLERWQDPRFTALIRIYLEELGEGIADRNHVLIYRRLLARHGLESWRGLPHGFFVQGAIQLALARHAQDFLPEVIGFNLGYEQLPLHLLISAYELDELGLDPYYFTLHVTVDNAASGHARRALGGLFDALPQVGDAQTFYRRVIDGYCLSLLGTGSTAVIEGFDLHDELVAMLAAKAPTGAMLHSDRCRLEGRSVNDWLAEPAQMPAFLQALERSGWIVRHQDPRSSRFWRLIHGERARMFGVFTDYEQQLLKDWIAGDFEPPRQPSFTARRKAPALSAAAGERPTGAARGLIRRHAGQADEFNADLRLLENELAELPRAKAMPLLIDLLAPTKHHTPAGLMATRIFSRLLA
jgi:hypothetical protein